MRRALRTRLTGALLTFALLAGCAGHASRPPRNGARLAGAADYGLPVGARLIEVARLGSSLHPDRALLLWMIDPEEVPFWGETDDPYTCPDETSGSHYRGPTRISLLDTGRRRVLNTLEILNPVIKGEGSDALSIPYRIRPGYYYSVREPVRQDREGRPTILALADVNGDGRPHELVLYHKLNCAVVLTTLIGYSEARDQVIQYPVTLTIEKGKETWRETMLWVTGLFAEAPASPGRWNYELDFTGRGGCVNHYEVDYQPSQEAFAGREVLTQCPDDG